MLTAARRRHCACRSGGGVGALGVAHRRAEVAESRNERESGGLWV